MTGRAPLYRDLPHGRIVMVRVIGLAMALAAGVAIPAPAVWGQVVRVQETRPHDAAACDAAGQQAETALQLPPGLLRAIGRVESGRRDPVSGAFGPWPWTINAGGQGRFFADSASAAAAVQALRDSGTASVDVGCFQVNLMHHPLAFRRVEDGFDPAANAAYAGRFLLSLRLRLGAWEAAVAAYHSATAERGEAYRARVYAAWNLGGVPMGVTGGVTGGVPGGVTGVGGVARLPARQVTPVVIRISGPELAGPDSVIRVWTPARPGAAPRLVAMPAPTVPDAPAISDAPGIPDAAVVAVQFVTPWQTAR